MRKHIEKFKNIFYINLFSKIKVNILIAPFFYFAYKLGFLELLLISYITALMHELFHIIAMKIMKVPFRCIEVQPFGICVCTSELAISNSTKEALIALSGPFYNFLCAIILCLISEYVNSMYIDYAIKINLCMGAFNLIPALPLDGGRILRSLLCLKFGILKSYNFMITLSNRLICVIIASGIIILIFAPFNFSLILIGTFLLSNISNEEKSLSHIMMKEILKSNDKNSFCVPKKTKVITVYENMLAKCIFRLLSYDYYLFFIIENKENSKIYATESEVLSLILKKGVRAKFSDIK